MRIVFLGFTTNYGGASRSQLELAKRLSEHVDVSVVDAYGCCEPYVQAAKAAGLDFHVLRPRSSPKIIGGRGPIGRASRVLLSLPELIMLRSRTRKLLNRLGASVVCANNAKSIMLATRLFSRRQPVPLIMHMRGWYTPDMVPLHTRWLLQKRCAGLLAVSQATKAALICSGIDTRKIHVLPNPIDVEAIAAKADRPLDADLPQMDRPVRILLPAALLRTKGQHTAVAAMRRILDAGHNAVLWLAGGLSFGVDQTYVPKTQELARQLGVADRVEWLGLRTDMPQLMKAATLVALPTWTEGMPRAVLEAMALAKPVATTPVGGIVDLILHSVTGLLFDVEDDEGLAACVDRFVRDGDEARSIGLQAQRFMRMNFQPAQQIEKALAIFQRLVK
jgi:glycosyltransferase involved in cell wall biosynthesis